MSNPELCKLCRPRGDKPFRVLFDGPEECPRCGRRVRKYLKKKDEK